MVNTKLRVVSSADAPAQTEGPELEAVSCTPNPAEGHRLLSAFLQIGDAEKRAWLIETAERMARS